MSQFPSEEMENFILSDNQEGMIEISTAMNDQTYLHLLTESRASQMLTYDSFDNINNTENDDPFRFLSQEPSVPVTNNHVPNQSISSSETPFLEPFQNSIHTKLAKDTSLYLLTRLPNAIQTILVIQCQFRTLTLLRATMLIHPLTLSTVSSSYLCLKYQQLNKKVLNVSGHLCQLQLVQIRGSLRWIHKLSTK